MMRKIKMKKDVQNMAFITLDWTKTDPISIKDHGIRYGFCLPAIYLLSLSPERRNWIAKEVVSCIIEELDATWEKDKWATSLSKVNKGVYVIKLSGNVCIQYPNKES
jgi:hypothetical protein